MTLPEPICVQPYVGSTIHEQTFSACAAQATCDKPRSEDVNQARESLKEDKLKLFGLDIIQSGGGLKVHVKGWGGLKVWYVPRSPGKARKTCSCSTSGPSFFDPEGLQSGFEVNFLFSSWSAQIMEICLQNFQRVLPANFAPNFRPYFSRVEGPPENSHPKFTSKIVGTPLQLQIFEPEFTSRRFSAYGGVQNFDRSQIVSKNPTKISSSHRKQKEQHGNRKQKKRPQNKLMTVRKRDHL